MFLFFFAQKIKKYKMCSGRQKNLPACIFFSPADVPITEYDNFFNSKHMLPTFGKLIVC